MDTLLNIHVRGASYMEYNTHREAEMPLTLRPCVLQVPWAHLSGVKVISAVTLAQFGNVSC